MNDLAEKERAEAAVLFDRYAADLLSDIGAGKRELDAYARREIRDAVVACSQHGVVVPPMLLELLVMAMPVTQDNRPWRSPKWRKAAMFFGLAPRDNKPSQTAIKDRFAGNSKRANDWLKDPEWQRLAALMDEIKYGPK